MKLKNNVNYFKKNDSLKFIGAAMAILGFLLYYVGWGWISYIIICTFIPAGAVLFIVGSSGRASEDDIDEFIKIKTRELDPNLDLDKDYSKRIMKHSEAINAEGYEYRQGLMFKKPKSGTVRSSEYTASVIYTLTDAFHLTSRSFSLVSDEEPVTSSREISFDSIKTVEFRDETKRLTFGGNSFSVKDTRLFFVMNDDSEISIPVHDDLNSENLAENFNHILDNYRKSKSAGN